MMALLGALITALIFTAVFSFGFEGERRVGGLLIFFALLFFPVWTIGIWLPHHGHMFAEASWVSFLVIGAIFAVFILAASPMKRVEEPQADVTRPTDKEIKFARQFSLFFWLFIVFMVSLILVNMLFMT